MINSLLESVELKLDALINPAGEKKRRCVFWDGLLEEIKADKAKLSEHGSYFLEGGHVDYYSRHVEDQLKYKSALLEKYEKHLFVAQLIYRATQDLKEIADETREDFEKGEISEEERDETLDDLQKSLLSIVKSSDPLPHLYKIYPDIPKKREQHQRALVPQNEQNQEIEEDMLNRFSFDPLADLHQVFKTLSPGLHETSRSIERELKRHQKITEKLPHGMQDVKKALSFLHAKPVVQLSADPAINQSLKDGLETLRTLMKKSKQDYQALLISGGDINVLLHQSTAFYWESLRVYHRALNSICDQLPQNELLTKEGQEVCQCLEAARLRLPSSDQISEAMAQVKVLDANLSMMPEIHESQIEGGQQVGFYPRLTPKIMNYLLGQDGQGQHPIFFMPYNYRAYIMDYPPKQDYIDALGNCYGETHMFIQKLNTANPSINNICPERELINYQLNQTRRAGKESEQKNLGRVDADENGIRWEHIKDYLTGPTSSSKHGDICFLSFTGAQKEGRAKSIGHTMAFVHMNEANPYKYVLFDYNMGTMGFSDEKHLETYFNALLSKEYPFLSADDPDALRGYPPFRHFGIQKEGEVCDELKNFLDNIKPLTSAQALSHKHTYWDKDNLAALVKHYDPQDAQALCDLSTILNALDQLPSVDDRNAISSQLSAFYKDQPLSAEDLTAIKHLDQTAMALAQYVAFQRVEKMWPEAANELQRQHPGLPESLQVSIRQGLETKAKEGAIVLYPDVLAFLIKSTQQENNVTALKKTEMTLPEDNKNMRALGNILDMHMSQIIKEQADIAQRAAKQHSMQATLSSLRDASRASENNIVAPDNSFSP